MGQQALCYFAAQVSFKASAFPSAAAAGMLGQLNGSHDFRVIPPTCQSG